MDRWTAEADDQIPALTDGKDKAAETKYLSRQQREADELYGLHNLVVLEDLLKRHLNLH